MSASLGEKHAMRGRRHLGLGLSVSLTALSALVAPGSAEATDYYVATTGSDSNAGTMAAPFATLQKGVNVAVAGDTVFIRAGTYASRRPPPAGAGIKFTKSGTSDTNRINYWAYPGEVPVFDFTNMVISTTGYTHGFVVSGSWLHFKGLEIAYVPMNTFSNNGVAVSTGGNCIFELLNMHHNSGNGIFIGKGDRRPPGAQLRRARQLRCDVVARARDRTPTASASTTRRRARPRSSAAAASWWNSDDGYDLINQEVPVTVENSWAMGNGFAMYGTFNPDRRQRQRLQDGEQRDRRAAPGPEQRGLEEQGVGLLRQPFVGREHLVQQHVVHERHAIQHAGQPARAIPTRPSR